MKSSVKLYDKGKEKKIKTVKLLLEVDLSAVRLSDLFEVVEEIKEKCCESGAIDTFELNLET